jgi:hypothetical protein
MNLQSGFSVLTENAELVAAQDGSSSSSITFDCPADYGDSRTQQIQQFPCHAVSRLMHSLVFHQAVLPYSLYI